MTPRTTSINKINLYFTYESCGTLKSLTWFIVVKTFTKLDLEHSDKFHVVVFQRTAKKCTKGYNARAQPLFCSLNLLFGDVPVAVAIVFCVRSIFKVKRLDARTS